MIVTLLTDFGRTDHYVAAMKGVLLSRTPGISIVDITHEIPAHDTESAAFLIHSVYRDFPPGTTHLVVVDPGVGSARDPIALRSGGHFFVGPGNGIFDLVRGDDAGEARVIEHPRLRRETVSRTFHGRDIFAPTAAALASGFPFDEIGSPADLPPPDSLRGDAGGGGVLKGRILHVDRFGNCVTSLTAGDLSGGPGAYRFEGAGWMVDEVREFYAAGEEDGPFLIEGSSGYLEIAVDRGSAADVLSLRRGDPVCAVPRSAGTARQSRIEGLP